MTLSAEGCPKDQEDLREAVPGQLYKKLYRIIHPAINQDVKGSGRCLATGTGALCMGIIVPSQLPGVQDSEGRPKRRCRHAAVMPAQSPECP